MVFFEFPEDARWSDERDAVEFSVILRPYEGTGGSLGGSSRASSNNVRRSSGASRLSTFSEPGSR
jgi:hypothetical protein